MSAQFTADLQQRASDVLASMNGYMRETFYVRKKGKARLGDESVDNVNDGDALLVVDEVSHKLTVEGLFSNDPKEGEAEWDGIQNPMQHNNSSFKLKPWVSDTSAKAAESFGKFMEGVATAREGAVAAYWGDAGETAEERLFAGREWSPGWQHFFEYNDQDVLCITDKKSDNLRDLRGLSGTYFGTWRVRIRDKVEVRPVYFNIAPEGLILVDDATDKELRRWLMTELKTYAYDTDNESLLFNTREGEIRYELVTADYMSAYNEFMRVVSHLVEEAKKRRRRKRRNGRKSRQASTTANGADNHTDSTTGGDQQGHV
eukprot:Clim_evm31s247 gene=Clim_evmTU31s247